MNVKSIDKLTLKELTELNAKVTAAIEPAKQRAKQEILAENKRVMKEILILAEMCLPAEKFENFRHSTFNHFGLSGLETKIKKTLDKYSEPKEQKDGQ